MKTKLSFLLTLCFIALVGFSQQPQQQIWYLQNQSVDFRGVTPILTQGLNGFPINFTAGSSINGVHNQTGDLLFYVAGDKVIGSSGNSIGQLSIFGVQSHGEMSIVPVPNTSCQYYVITKNISFGAPCSPTAGFLHNLSYSTIDMSLNGGLGGIVSTGTILNSCEYFGGTAIAVGKLNTNNTQFLYQVGILGNSNLEITRYTIDNTGVINTPTILYSSNAQGLSSSVAELDLSFNDDRLAFAVYNELFILNLDGNGNVITGVGNQGNGLSKFTIGTEYLTGVEFSTTGSNLFVGQRNTGIHIITNTTTGTSTPLLGVPVNYGNSQLETAYDALGNNEIYVADGINGLLGKITNPNGSPTFSPGVLTGYTPLQDPNTATAVYQLPDQIDNYDYSSQFVNLSTACCVATSSFDVEPAKSNEEHSISATWSLGVANNPFNATGNVTVKDRLVIKSGANITINNMRFEFAPEAQLIIENGARLTINGTTLTADTRCDSNAMWHGVEVWGTGTGTFQPQFSGRFVAKNNSLIEHAMVATANFKHQQNNGSPVINTTVAGFNGGIIQAENTTFRNNYIDTKFEAFFSTLNNDQSRFKECHFVTDAHLNNPTLNPYAHADLNKVRGINFLACKFETILTGLTAYPNMPDRGYGILAYETLFNVRDKCPSIIIVPNPCPNPIPSEFNNLFLGILANGGSMPSQTASVVNSKFNNNYGGMYFQNLNLAQVVNNDIFVGIDISTSLLAFGLYLSNSDKYKVEDNRFSTAVGYYGAYINHSGTGANEIYRNSFENFVVATQAASINGDGSSAGNGLQFKCNKYTNTADYDILISSGLIKAFHGKCGTIQNPTDPTTPSNNEFSYTAQFGDFWMTNNTTPPGFNVSYQMAQDPNAYQTIPRDYPNNATHYNQINTNPTVCTGITYDPNTSCPQRVGKTVIVLNQLIAANKVVTDNLQAQIDGGNTANLINTIVSEPAWKVRNELMAASPNLSDAVLLALLNSNMPDWVHQQVLSANAPLSDNVFLAAVNRIPALPENIIRDIALASSPLHTTEQLALINHTPKYADWVLTAVMEQNSPLKDEVLTALINKTPSISHSSIRNILLKNTPLSSEVNDAMNNHLPSYPSWVINAVNNSNFVAGVAIDEPQPSSVVSELTNEINYYQAETERYRSDILRIYLFDEDGADAGISDVINYLEVENCPKTSSKCLLTSAYLANEQYSDAQATIDTLANDTANSAYCMLYNSVIQYQQMMAKEYELLTNSSLRTPVETVALSNSNNTEVGVANTVLSVINNQFIAPTFELVTPNNNQRLIIKEETNNAATLTQINVYPNPAKEQVTLTHNLSAVNGNITLTFTDLMGRKLLTETINNEKNTININSLKTGIYFYTITQNNTNIKTDKLVVE